MSSLRINFKKNINNTSLQVGDDAYFTQIENVGSTSTDPGVDAQQPQSPVKRIGVVEKIYNNAIVVGSLNFLPSEAGGDYVMFSKNKSVNNTSLLGYYTEVKLSNNSINDAELFALSSEIAISSK